MLFFISGDLFMSYTISDDDRAIWQSAKEAQDWRTGKTRRGLGSWEHEREPRPVPGPSAPRSSKRRVRVGQRLFYRDKFTGIIEMGIVTGVDKYSFKFTFNERSVWLDYGVLGTRLFFSYKGVRLNYQKHKA